MKLISMTDFVLNQRSNLGLGGNTYQCFTGKVTNYASFLKQPLTLGMFVPCYPDGTFFEEPQMRYVRVCFDTEDLQYDKDELEDYIIAKRRVLFKDFNFNWHHKKTNSYWIASKTKTVKLYDFDLKDKTVEDLIKYSLELTENTIKKLK